MQHSDIADVLTAAAAYDGRTFDRTDTEAWYAAIGDLQREDALAAVVEHYRTQTEWLKPGHVFQLATARRVERQRLQRELEEREQRRREIEGGPRSEEVAALVRQTAAKWSSPDGVRERALLVARRMKGRPDTSRKTAHGTTAGTKKRAEYPPPMSAAEAGLARQYLADGYRPDDLVERLGISRKWLRRAAADRGSLPPPTPVGPLRTPGEDTNRQT